MHYGTAAVFYPRFGGRAGAGGVGCTHRSCGVSDGGGVAVAVGAPGFVGGGVFCAVRVFVVATAGSCRPAGRWWGAPIGGALLSGALRPHHARLLAGGGDGATAVPGWPAALLGRGAVQPHSHAGVCSALAHRWAHPNVEFVRGRRVLPASAAGSVGVVGVAGEAGAVAHPHYWGGVRAVLGLGVGVVGAGVGAVGGP